MKRLLMIGALLIGATASVAEALPELPPVSRTDAVEIAVREETARLALIRPQPRPEYLYVAPGIRVSGPLEATPRPEVRDFYIPRARWDHLPDGQRWSLALMGALSGSAAGLSNVVPRDIDNWCPAYTDNPPQLRRAFWVGMMSALAKHESTFRPTAVGGGGQWFGLLQIYPPTAQFFGCQAQSGEALKDPVANLGCAARIMATTVRRDNAIAIRDSRWRGVAADWGPMSNPAKIAEMSAWTRRQGYCVPLSSHRPMARPDDLMIAQAD